MLCSACKTGLPKVGDRVMVEAQFNSNMPFKWNASRVQILSVDVSNLMFARLPFLQIERPMRDYGGAFLAFSLIRF